MSIILTAQKQSQSKWVFASAFSVCLFAICLPSFPKGYIVGSAVALLISLAAVYKKQLCWHENLTLLTIALALFIAPHFISFIQNTSELSELKKAARGLPLLIFAGFILYHKPKKELVYSAFAIGLIISFAIMLNEQFSGFDRNHYAGFHLNPLMIAIVAVLAFILPQTNCKKNWIRILMYTAYTLTVATVIMSESKGPALALLSVIIAFSILPWLPKKYSKSSSKRNILILWLLMAASASITSVLTDGALLSRVSSASHDVIQRMEVTSNESKSSSSAIRFELWKGALILASEKPIFGYGTLDAQNRMLELVNEERVANYIRDYTHSHFHSIYFQALGNRGTIGLLSVLILFIIPSIIFIKNKNVAPSFSLSGLLVIISYLIAGAADVALTSTLPSITYFLIITLCVSQVSINQKSICPPN